ncbi:MAG: VIT family protein [Ancrocorticia sp.]|jgi:VIT1/CCC1 family predicted Fe2+/Mn2+ transporter|nr:VIT family protein [Ancrocorticia sp.]MCI1895853.1 VIT family protein [Ancrocorticia sp.]MCI1932677.1 VIT family protein [Ancrocorticia sp.]MCI2029649.1 VIT family protein [Ancrocorticia sp.]
MTVAAHTTAEDLTEDQEIASKLNWLRAAVLGANDGIVSTAGIVVGVAGAAVSTTALFASGVAGVVAGAISMAAGEYVSVSTQRDTERAIVNAEKIRLSQKPEHELRALSEVIESRGVTPSLSREVAFQLTQKDAVRAQSIWRFGIDPDAYTNPWHAAFASMLSFVSGALIPFVAILTTPAAVAVPITVAAVTIALAITGSISARLGGAPQLRATLRNIVGGLLAMGVTYSIGLLVGHFA